MFILAMLSNDAVVVGFSIICVFILNSIIQKCGNSNPSFTMLIDKCCYSSMLLSMNERHSSSFTIVISRINYLLIQNGMSRAALARHFGLSRSSITQKLNGDITFTLRDLTALADLFHVSVDELLGREPMEVK